MIRATPRTLTQKELRSFLGIVEYYQRFIRLFVTVSAVLKAATSVKTNFIWTSEMESSFDDLNGAINLPHFLAFPDFEKPFVVETDASTVVVLAVLA